MTKGVVGSLLFLVTLATPAYGQSAPFRIPPEQASSHVGQVATVCSVVVGVSCGGEGVTLTLGTTLGDERVRIRFPNAGATALGARPHRLAGYNVCGTGTITRVESGHEVVVTSADAIDPLKATLAADSAGFGPNAHHLCDPDVKGPTLRKSAPPNYTAGTRAARIQGNVYLQAVVLANGKVGDVRVVSGLHRELDRESIAAMKRFEFTPGTYKGSPAPVVVSGEMAFTLKQ